jgi:hypothetical protein
MKDKKINLYQYLKPHKQKRKKKGTKGKKQPEKK